MAPKTNYLEHVLGENPEARIAIREIPLLRQGTESLLELIYRYGRIFALRENEELTRENEFDQWVFFVLNGRLAVYVGDDRVDTISSSLVGERCILGESRKATLRAAEGGMTALGVDMAVLDALQQPGHRASEGPAVFVELLAIITGEIVRRVADLSYGYFDIVQKYQAYLELEKSSEISEELKDNGFQADPEANIEIYKHLYRRDKVLLARFCSGSRLEIDTAGLFAHCMNSGRQQLLYDLANALRSALAGRQNGHETAHAEVAAYTFPEFSRRTLAALNSQLAANGGRGRPGTISQGEWAGRFRTGPQSAAELAGVCDWLRDSLGFSDLDVVNALMVVLREASTYTALINGSIKAMVREIGRIEFITQMEADGGDADIPILEFLDTRSPDELIPLFSKHVLEVHLVRPYLDQLGLSLPNPETPVPTEEEASPPPPTPQGDDEPTAQNLADSLFD
jgi:CRP-like cAMP-binding protein